VITDSPPAGARQRYRWLPETVASLVVVLAVLGPVLRRGFVLRYDLVFVPDPPLNEFTIGADGGLPRAVPSEMVAVALGNLLPADIAEKLLLAGILMLGCVGAARLAPVRHPAARVAAGVLYVWNPWVYGRLHLGQWAILAAYAALPWVFALVVHVVGRRDRSPLPAVLGAVPLAFGGPALALVGALLVGAPLALARRWWMLLTGGLVLAGLSAPWLIPVFTSGGELRADPDGLPAFAARADTPLGVLGSVLTLGGVWSSNAAPPGRESWWVAVPALLLTAAALYGYVLLRHRWPAPVWGGLAVAAGVGLVLALLTSVPVVADWLVDAAEPVPALTALRDGTRLLAPLALVQAVGLAGAVEALARRRDRLPLAALAVLAPVALLPSLAWGLGGTLRLTDYPAEWATVRHAVDADPAPGAVLVLPWSTFRGYPWNDRTPLLDPAPRMFDRLVITADDVRVGPVTIGGENPRNRRIAALLAGPGPLDPAALRAAGVRYVLVERDQPGAEAFSRVHGAVEVHRGESLVLMRLPGPTESTPNSRVCKACWLGYGVAMSTLLTLVVIALTRSRARMLLSGNPSWED